MGKKWVLAAKAVSVVVICLSLLWSGLALAAEDGQGSGESGEETEESSEAEEKEEQEAWQQAEIFLSIASAAPGSGEALREEIRRASGGRIFCNTYWDGSMGNDSELTAAVREGTISIVSCATSSQSRLIPELGLLDIPYLFASSGEYDEKLKGSLVDFFQPYYNSAGLQLITWYCPDLRKLTCSFPPETADDLKKLRIRLMDNQYHEIYWKAVGAETFNIPIGNLFYSLQQGLVNAQESPPYTGRTPEFYELQNTIVMTFHVPYIGSVVMNKEAYDSLAPEDRELLEKVFRDYYAGNTGSQSMLTEETLKNYYEHVIIPEGELREALLAGVPAVEEALRQDLGDEIVDAFYAILQEE